MRIEHKGVTITGLPGIRSITVESSTEAPGVGIDINTHSGETISFGVDQVKELIAGLKAALTEADRIPGTPPGGSWAHIEDVPDGVKSVIDRAGDKLYKLENGLGWSYDGPLALEGTSLYTINHFAPFWCQ